MSIETRGFAPLESSNVSSVSSAERYCVGVHYEYSREELNPIEASFTNLPCFKVRLDRTGRGGRHGLTPEEHTWLHENTPTFPIPSVEDMMEAIRTHRATFRGVGLRCPNCLTTEEFRARYLAVSLTTSLDVFMSKIGVSDKVKAGEILANLGITAVDAVACIEGLSPYRLAELLLAPLRQ